MTALTLTAHDPLVARDGRPFGAGQGARMRGLPWPYPSVVAGSLRTALGKRSGRDFDPATAADLLTVEVAGVLPVADGRLYLPAPADCVVHPDRGRGLLRPRPEELGDGEGGDFPAAGLRPVVLSAADAADDFKPKDGPAWWPADALAGWLTETPVAFDRTFLGAAQTDYRDHVHLDAATGAAADGQLFTTANLTVTHLPRYGANGADTFADRFAEFAEVTLAARVRADDGWADALAHLGWHPLGGERRLAHWAAGGGGLWKCPPAVTGALAGAKKVRMALATPAIFSGGWRPGWLGERTSAGSPPGSSVELKLVGLSIGRWRAVSGWSMQPHRETGRPGPKAVRRLVPAGGVYFFDVVGGDPDGLAGRWLEPVSDDGQDRRDGFGLAVWGTW